MEATPWTVELLAAGVGMMMSVGDTITKECARSAKGRSKGNGEGDCYNCGSPAHFFRQCRHPPTGQSKGKGFQGERYNCGEAGHLARECPKGKEGRKSKPSIQGVGKAVNNIVDQDGYELAKWPRILAHCMPEIFAVDAEGSGDSVTKESL
jgi:hypothetical protein